MDHGDLLSMLVLGESADSGMSKAEQHMSDKQARDELLTLFLAGHETTALAVTYTFYLLAHNPGPRPS